jgi:AcrR family transcriptional regulator
MEALTSRPTNRGTIFSRSRMKTDSNQRGTAKKRSAGTIEGRRTDGLEPADIIAVTLAMASKVGFARLSMRQISARLGVTATALYYHFHDKSELLDRVAGHIMDSIEAPKRSLPWSERLRQVILAQQRTLMAYPGLARFMVHHRESAGAMRWMEMILEVLHDAGFSKRETTRALATLSFFVHPLTLVDDRPHLNPEYMYRRRQLDSRLKADPTRYPHLKALLPALVEYSYDAVLPVALDGVIAGIETRHKPADRRIRRKTARG